MAGENVVKVVVQAADDTAGGFASVKAGAEDAGESMDTYAASVDKASEAQARFDDAQKEQADAAAKVAEIQKDEAASVDELTAAQQRLTEASIASADARSKLATAEADVAAKTKIASDEQVESGVKSDESAGLMAGAGSKAKMAFLGIAVGAGYAIDKAMEYDEQSTQLVTGAGELDKNLAMVKKGMLDVSTQTATSTAQIQAGMYMIESAGYHGAAGLNVLKAAAEGAKVGNADLGTVADATTTVLTDYKMKATDAASATSGLVATVAAGKTHLSDLSSSLSKVLPTASALGISFDQVGGAMATMTGQGVSARLAATHLNSTLLAMASASPAAAAALQQVGLSSTQVGNTLTHQGLIAALQEVTDAAAKKFPVGSAAYVASVDKMLGGSAGLSTALQLTGKHMDTLKANTDSVSASMKSGGKDVQGWNKVQEDASFRLEKTKQAAENTAVSFGEALMPAVTALLGPISTFLGFISQSTAASTALAAIIGGALAVYLGSKLVNAFSEVGEGAKTMLEVLPKIAAKIGLVTTATKAQTTATEAETAATEEADAAMSVNPVMLIIAAIALLVIGIVELIKHWNDVEAVAKTVWKAITEAVSTAFDWIKSHWPLLLAILTGPIGAAALFIVDHWKTILNGAKSMLDDVVSFFKGLPGRIASALGSLGSMMFNAGVHAIESLISGITSMIGSVGNVMGGIASKIAGFIGLSPAKEGPLSGSGAPEIRGQHIAADIAKGMMSGHGAIASAAQHLAGTAAIGSSGGTGGGAAGGGGPMTIQLQAGGGSGLDQMFMQWLKQTVRVSGGDPRIFNKKVAFLGS